MVIFRQYKNDIKSTKKRTYRAQKNQLPSIRVNGVPLPIYRSGLQYLVTMGARLKYFTLGELRL